MKRIDHPTAIDIAPGKKGFRGRDAINGATGTRVTSAWLNDKQEELLGFIEKSGLSEGAATDILARAARSQRLNYVGEPGGTANAIALTLDPAPAALADLAGVPLRIRIGATNTGAATLNVNGLGAIPILRVDGSPAQAGDLVAGQIVTLIYDGTAFRPIAVPGVAARWIRGAIAGAAATVNLTANDEGRLYAGRVGGVTYHLPAPSAAPGAVFAFIRDSGGSVTITTPSGTLLLQASQPTSYALPRTNSYIVLYSTGTAWVPIGSSPDIEHTQSIAGTGWQRLPSGLILQWGTFGPAFIGNGIGTTDTTGLASFPLAFPTACVGLWATGWDNPFSPEGSEMAIGVAVRTATQYQFRATRVAGAQAGAEQFTIQWLALGY